MYHIGSIEFKAQSIFELYDNSCNVSQMMAESESGEDAEPPLGEANAGSGASGQPTIVRRARSKNDRMKVDDLIEDLVPYVNKKKKKMNLDFRSYGKLMRTSGLGPLCFQGGQGSRD